jgi:hypothetical protein
MERRSFTARAWTTSRFVRVTISVTGAASPILLFARTIRGAGMRFLSTVAGARLQAATRNISGGAIHAPRDLLRIEGTRVPL